MNQLTINLQGGLGNQLFQIFNIISLSKKYSLNPCFFSEIKNEDGNTVRHTYFEQLLPSLNIEDKINNNSIYLNHDNFVFEDIILSPKKDYHLNGLYQSYKYLTSLSIPEIKSYFQLQEEDKSIINNFKHLKDYKTLVSVHIRRGDYLKVQHFHNILPVQYYQKAYLNYFAEFDEDTSFVIFSDDIEWCKQYIKFFPHMYYMENQKDYIELLLMSECDHNIIANSSFSWWGAYLNENPEKIVVCPHKWFEIGVDTKDLRPKEWKNI